MVIADQIIKELEETEAAKVERTYRQVMPAPEVNPKTRFAFCTKCWAIHEYRTGDPVFYNGEYTAHHKYITSGMETRQDALHLQARIQKMREDKL